MPLSVPEFVTHWKASELGERQASQSQFNDLCDVLGQQRPAQVDHTGEFFTFDRHVSKDRGGKGFADVWKKGCFGWEYKGRHKDLNAAYNQLLNYREDLENPPLFVVSDMHRFEVHTNFPNTRKRIYSFNLDDLLANKPTATCELPPLDVLHALFEDPFTLHPSKSRQAITEEAAAEFDKLSANLRFRNIQPEKAAHFMMRLLFCLFADDIGLLPDRMFHKMLETSRGNPASFNQKLKLLFAAMVKGGIFGVHDVPWFNGGLFRDDEIVELSSSDLQILFAGSTLNWSYVEPAIFGTLFERNFDPEKHNLVGAHYTSKEDILLIIEPVLVEPLVKRWHEVKAKAEAFLETAKAAKNTIAYNKARQQAQDAIAEWLEELSAIRVLDPARGSGNFLYLALKRMLDIWKQAYVFSSENGLRFLQARHVSPHQLYGIEKNLYAHELASVVVWIGYLQWQKENGMGEEKQPILDPLNKIEHRDAILDYTITGDPYEPAWPKAEYIIGNPPFLGGKRLRTEIGDKYVDDLFTVYDGRVPAEADLVVYWFEKARALVEQEKVQRVGLLATQGIRGGANRVVLENIKKTGDIFWAQSDRDWILDGANVHVSMVGFDDGSQKQKSLDDALVSTINPDLTSEADTTTALLLPENARLCFMGTTKIGAFDLAPDVAREMLAAPLNPNGRPNSDVVRPWVNAMDVTRRPRGVFIIDFGTDMSEAKAALYEMPFEYLRRNVYEERQGNNREVYRTRWWIHGEPRPDMREALKGQKRYVITPRVSKYRLFSWLTPETLADSATFIFARDDDYFFGVLHSRLHEVWGLHMGTALEDRPRYTPTSTFETFPFPWPPSKEPVDDARVKAIAAAARELVEKRDAWLNPPGAAQQELTDRTLTNLYNNRPAWLDDAHRKLDQAVFAAYGWPSDIPDSEILSRLLALNHERAQKSSS